MTKTGTSFGRFSRDGARYEITASATPRPWENILFSETFYAARVGQCGQNYSMYKARAVNRVTREGRFFYLRDLDAKYTWTANGYPYPERLRGYRCTHTPAHTEIKGSCRGVRTKLTVFVPRDANAEIWSLAIRNASKRPRRLASIAYFPWLLWNGGTGGWFLDQYAHAEWREEIGGALVAQTRAHFAPREKFVGFATSVPRPAAYDASERAFFGPGGDLYRPAAVERGACFNSSARVEELSAALSHEISLAPGEETTIYTVFGVADDLDEAGALVARFSTEEGIARAREAQEAYWRDVAVTLRIETPDADVNHQINVWVKRETIMGAKLYRCAQVYNARNTLQDAQGLCFFETDFAREALLLVARHQSEDGTIPRSFPRAANRDAKYFLAMGHKDTPPWFALAAATYAEETGDLDFLTNTRAPYHESAVEENILEHVVRGLDQMTRDLGPHGLSHIGGGDWFDPLDHAGVEGRGESVWLTEALVWAIRRIGPVLEAAGMTEAARSLAGKIAPLSEAVNTHGWDGAWYLYGYTDAGRPVGTARDSEARIWLNSQSWAILSGIPDAARTEAVLRAVDEHLDSPWGLAVLAPPYTGWREDIGELADKLPGVAENGSCYNHAGAFMVAAKLRAGRASSAVRSLARILPTNPENPPENSLMVPIFVPNEYNGPGSATAGRAATKFFTGTCPWLLMIAANDLAGARARVDGLEIDPCLPADWTRAKLGRPWRGSTYEIAIEKAQGVERGRVEVRLDGRKLKGTIIPPPEKPGERHRVRVRVT